MLTTTTKTFERIDYMDLVRVAACYMVAMIHVRGAFDLKTDDAERVYLSILRPCVPLFIMISGALLLPIKTNTRTFFKKRFSRVLIPFLLWSVIYVFLPKPGKIRFGGLENVLTLSDLSPIVKSLLMIPINTTWVNIHFWFMYTIIGLYLFMPIVSPWIEKVTKKGIEAFLLIWAATTILFYAKIWFPVIHGISDWNEFGMLYNFGGYLGYAILGYYLNTYNTLSKLKSIGIGLVLFAIGGYFTHKGFVYSLQFPDQMDWITVESQKIEFFINNLSLNVVMMTTGTFMILQKIKLSGIFKRIITELSKYSYALFLVHYIINIWLVGMLRKGVIEIEMSTWIKMPLLALIVFVLAYLVVKAISYLPKSKYLLG